MQVNISSNIKEVTRGLTRVQKKQIPFAASQTLNDLAFDLTKRRGTGAIGKEAKDTFQKKSGKAGATPWTTKGFFYDKSNKKNLTAWVFWDDDRGDYMKFQVKGGTRFPTKRSIRVATKFSNKYLDAFGNFKRGAMDEMLSDKSKFFSGVPKGTPKRKAGIWERYGRSKKFPGGRRIRIVAQWVKSATYRPLLPVGQFVEGFVFSHSKGFEPIFQKKLAKALKYAR